MSRRPPLRTTLATGLACTLALTACGSAAPSNGGSESRVTAAAPGLMPSTGNSGGAFAQPPTPTQAPSADTLPGRSASDLTARLTTWRQLIAPTPGDIPAATYADFLATRPVWPHWHLIEARYQKALANETDDTVAGRLCAASLSGSGPKLTGAQAIARCAGLAGMSPALRLAGRAAWRDSNDGAQDAAQIRSLFAADLTPEDSWTRFEREEKTGQLSAASQTAQLLPADRAALATARIAFRRNDPDAEPLAAAIPAAHQSDPQLLLDHLRWLRKAERLDDALTLWKAAGDDTERRGGTAMTGAFWTERDALARALLAQNRAADALPLADDRALPPAGTPFMESALLSGWITLRPLHDPAAAEPHFRLLTSARSPIFRSTGYYWLGRARDAAGDQASAAANWRLAGQAPQTFFGQMALSALAHDGATLLSPTTVPASIRTALARFRSTALQPGGPSPRIESDELARAARILVSWGEQQHAREFLTMLLARTPDTPSRDALARFAIQLGLPDMAVAVARLESREGIEKPALGWPRPFTPPASSLPPGFALALMRQESNFNPDAVSSSGAIGLMQLLPGTARDMARLVARQGGGTVPAGAAALHDPTTNMQLGTAYLDQIYTKLDTVVPFAAAGYNAGPHRVSQWLDAGGNPAASGDQNAMIDWIVSIPYAETRGYVMRVWESMALYAAENPA